jgi:hypothetical protein
MTDEHTIEYEEESLWESVRAWWFTRDAQEKQVALLAALSIFVAVCDVISALLRSRVGGSRERS